MIKVLLIFRILSRILIATNVEVVFPIKLLKPLNYLHSRKYALILLLFWLILLLLIVLEISLYGIFFMWITLEPLSHHRSLKLIEYSTPFIPSERKYPAHVLCSIFFTFSFSSWLIHFSLLFLLPFDLSSGPTLSVWSLFYIFAAQGFRGQACTQWMS